MVGKTLGHYQISFQLGKGGMGEVYQAKDQKLGRDVAIKVLPEEFAKDADRVARFQREAKLLASLNHTNIAAIHGLEESGGTSFLVLELVEGQTLADRIKDGPIPVEESLKLALQIAEALEAAHEKGVIHRDLKPANIKVTPDGKVKVLDFGLAKAFAGEHEELNLSNSPTLSNAATQQGVILGTAAYMSPEQAKGKTVDKRADVWAFGCVVFEMLTGRSLFSADDVSQTLARVLERQPDFSFLPANLHPKIASMLERCLEKDARNRYSGISDARVDIQKALADSRGLLVRPDTAAETSSRLRTILPWIAAVIAFSGLTGIAVWKLKSPERRQVIRFDYDLPEDQKFGNLGLRILSIAPDGKRFVYSTSKGLYQRSMEDLTARLVAGTEGATQSPFFSPDGEWIGYFSVADRKLKKIAINGGIPVVLCDFTQIADANWSANDEIVYGQISGDIMRISANGGAPESLIKTKPGGIDPRIISGGKSVLYTTPSQPFRIMGQSLKSEEPKELFHGMNARYLPTGHIVYALENNLFAVPFDPDKLTVTGGHVPVIKGIYRATAAQYAVSDSGTLIYIPDPGDAFTPGRTLVWVDRRGREEPIAAIPNFYSNPNISPDGTRVAVTIGMREDADIWVWDLVRETLERLTLDRNEDLSPHWTPDGRRIVFFSYRDGIPRVAWKAADGTGEIEIIGAEQQIPNLASYPESWSSDGKTLVLHQTFSGAGSDIGMLSMEGDHKWKPLLQERYAELQPKISPDGRWMAYTSDETGRYEIYVRSFPEVEKGRWQVTTSGGESPLWSPNGRELFFRNGDSVMAVSVETEPAFKPGKPEILFRGSYGSSAGRRLNQWDISPEGKRFLMIKQPGSTPSVGGEPRKIHIVLNWFEELKQRVPGK
jgi:eukaryotic-like serine/threonine-protein kinase